MVHSTQWGQESGEGRRIQSQTQNPTEDDRSDQEFIPPDDEHNTLDYGT